MEKRVLVGTAVLFLLIANVHGGGRNQAASTPEPAGARTETLRMVTGNITGNYYSFGLVVAQMLGDRLNIPISVKSTGASKANIELIDAGEADIAIVQNDVMHYAQYGMDLFNGERITSFSTMAALYPEICQIVVNTASGIRSVDDLRGKHVSVGEAGSGTEFNAREILEVYNIDLRDIRKENYSFAASAEALRNNTIDAFFCIAGTPTPVINDLISHGDYTILDIDDVHASQLIRNHPFYSRTTIPAETYRGQSTEIYTVAVKAAIIVSSSLSEEIVYQLTKGFFDSLVDIEQAHVKGSEVSILSAIEGISIPYHSGALRYYSEFGLSPLIFLPRIVPGSVR